jgi:hypothetical protein
MVRERRTVWREDGESLRGHKAQESSRPRPKLILWGAVEGHGFFCGSKPLERRHEVREDFMGKRKGGEVALRGVIDHEEGVKL